MWIRALGGVAIVLVLLVLCIPAWVVWQSRDLPEIDDADLLPRWSQVEPERNGFVALEAAAALLVASDEEIEPTALRGDRDALQELAPLVEANAPALAALELVLAAPEFQVPRIESSDEVGSNVDGCLRLTKLLAARGLLQGPGSEDGLADLFAALDLSRRIETARGAALVEVMIAIAMRSQALRALETWLGEGRLDADSARSLARRLAAYRSDPGAWARAMGVEYEFLKRVVIPDLERTRNGEIPGEDMTQGLHQLLPVRYYFHPKRTFQRFAERYRIGAENGGRFCTELAPIPGEGETPSPLRLFLSPNAGGEVLLAVGAADHHRFLERRCAADSQLGAVQTMAALRAWQLERGELPASLTELVPSYLDAVPEDAFDGQPLRWNAARAWLYSVGDDGSDEGGHEGEAPPGDTSEPTFPLGFVGPASGATAASAPSA
jgi:hypothetical protein